VARWLAALCAALLLQLAGGVTRGFAEQPGLEGSLRNTVEQILTLTKQIESVRANSPGVDEKGQLEDLHLQLQAGHLLMTERMRQRGELLRGMGEEQKLRHRLAVDHYQSKMNRLLTLLRQAAGAAVIDREVLAELREALTPLVESRPAQIVGALPYARPNLPARLPAATPGITPAYRLTSSPAPDPADLAATPEAPLSAPIVEQIRQIAGDAGRIHWDPAAIYNWVRTNIRTEWYWGCMKGAEETLRQRSGNAADQASLLISMLRASGYPARYVRGVMEFFPDLRSAAAMTGITDPHQLLDFYRSAGIPCEPVYAAGRIVNLRIEHLWVEALVPYADYRGIVADEAGKIWVPLDTSIKTGLDGSDNAIDLFAQEGSPLQGFRDHYLAVPREETPLELLAQESEVFLAANHPGAGFADTLHTLGHAPSSLGILPSSLQFVEVGVTAEYTALPPELLHQVRFSARDGDETLFDLTIPLPQLSNRKVMIGYLPETVADQETINLWAGLDNTPPYLVRLRPALLVDGETRAVGQSGLTPGDDFDLTVGFLGPAGQLAGSDSVTAGYPLLLGIVAQNALPPLPGAPASPATDRLFRSALAYVAAWDRDETTLGDLFNLALARPFPTCVRVGGMLRTEQLAGVLLSAEWEGLFIDADLRRVSAVPRVAAEPARVKAFMELSALSGSVHEHRLFVNEFAVEAMSTARLLGLVRGGGLPILTIDAGNAAALLPGLPLEEAVVTDILAAVNDGLRVHVPSSPVTFHAWRGIGYLKENPATGEAGYMLSGGLAGGQTVLGRRDWPAEVAAILSEPFNGPPNEDPLQAFTLVGVTPPELRLATAGEELPGPVMAMVRDAAGVPVSGALVTFTVRSGGGWFIDDRQQPASRVVTLTVISGRDGLARVRFVPGEQTAANPVVFVRSGDRQANLAGENLIDARLLSGSLASLSAPIAVFGFAGLPDPQQTRAYGHNLRGEVFSYSGDALVLLKDRFGNAVANHPVTFTAGAVQPAASSGCQNPPALAEAERNAVLLGDTLCRQRAPVYGECAAAAQVQVVSRSDGGALSGVVLGGVPYAAYPVTATFAGNGAEQRFGWVHYSNPFASCTKPSPPESRLVLNYQQRLDASGRNVDARPADRAGLLQVKSYLLAEAPVVAIGGDVRSCPDSPRVCNLVAGSGAFSLAAPSVVTVAGRPAMRAAPLNNSQELPWLYQTDVTLPAGLNDVAIESAALRTLPRLINSCAGCGSLEPAVEVAIGPVRRTVPVWGASVRVPSAVTALVNAQGIAQRDLSFGFVIEPVAYVANQAQVLLLRNGELWDTLPAGTSGAAAVTFPAGYWFDPKANYELQVLLNNVGEANAIYSGRIPLLQRTAAVDLRIDGLPDAVEDQVGAFVLLNSDFDEKEADPAKTLPDAATPSIVEADDELKRAWLQIDDSGGRGGSWQVVANAPARLRIYYRKNDQWVEFKPGDPPEPVSAFPAIIPLYLEGLAESAGIQGDMLTATFFPVDGGAVTDRLPLTVLDIDMAVDGNRDRVIDFQSAGDESAVFWVNNDHDYQHEEDGLPVEDDAASGDDSRDAIIACRRDLEDFARLHIRLGVAARPGALTYSVKLLTADDQVQPMLNLFPAVNLSDGYLGLPGNGSTPDQPDQQIMLRLLAAVGKLQAVLPADKIEADKNNYFLFEGRMPGKGRLVLTVSYQGLPVVTRQIELELVDPSWFYDHFVVSLAGEGEDAPVRPAVNPEGMAVGASRFGHYRPEGSDYVLFVHGWNMQTWEKRRWAETVFKRLWWQGYRGKVGLFDWPCRTLPSWDFLVNYDRSEFIAWQSAAALKGVLERLQGEHAGKVRLLAHSQGNVVAGEALRLGALGLVHTYVASQAALSAGLYEQKEFSPGLRSFELRTPDILARYPDSVSGRPYLEEVTGRAQKTINYYNLSDYALVGNTLQQPTWEYNNLTRPDGSEGYGYQGDLETYPPTPPAVGFYQDSKVIPLAGERRFLQLPRDSFEAFSFCAQSRTRALGAVRDADSVFDAAVDLFSFGYNEKRYSHSRQFRSDIIVEQNYWSRLVDDMSLGRSWR